MKSTGITKKIDDLGRIVIPKELLNSVNISKGDIAELFIEGDNIIITKYTKDCIFCGNTQNLHNFKDKNICTDCIKKIAEKSAI